MSSAVIKTPKTQCLVPLRRITWPQIDIDIKNSKKNTVVNSRSQSIANTAEKRKYIIETKKGGI